MSYSTLMTHLDLGISNKNVLHVTTQLVQRFKSAVIGISAHQPMPMTYGDGGHFNRLVDFPPLSDFTQDREDLERHRSEAEAALQLALHGKASHIEWRSIVSLVPLADYISHQARAADLLIISPRHGLSALDASRRVHIGDLVMRIGRPVLLVPPSVYALNLDTAMVAWKDTREARRALADALPLLKQCGRVVLVEMAPSTERLVCDQRLKDVSHWLSRHGIAAEVHVATSNHEDATQLETIANDHGAGLMIAGAYGHSRLKEWAFGGVTNDLLLNPARCTLVSH